MTETSKMTAQEYTNHLKFVEFAREEQRLFGHTDLPASECPPELLATDLAFMELTPDQQADRKWKGTIELLHKRDFVA